MDDNRILTAGEKDLLHLALQQQRAAIRWKVEDLDDVALRRPMTPSGTNLLGLVQHLAVVEYGWLCGTFGREAERLSFGDDDEDADMHIAPEVTTADVLALYDRATAAADQVIAELDLAHRGHGWFGDEVTLRYVLVHLIEETARHAGHADILRELLDGTTGYRAPGTQPAPPQPSV